MVYLHVEACLIKLRFDSLLVTFHDTEQEMRNFSTLFFLFEMTTFVESLFYL